MIKIKYLIRDYKFDLVTAFFALVSYYLGFRINGGWRPWGHKESGLTFSSKLSLDEWYKCTLMCDKDLVDIKISNNNGSTVLHRTWAIPHERFGFPFPQIENDPKPTIIHFPIDLDYGTAGFRNSGQEKAFIKNVLLERLSYGKS